MRHLIRIEVDGMLRRFDHVVAFPSDWEFVILHGPNGVGKTKLLELVSATFNFHLDRVASIPFNSARFDFDDDAKLRVTKVISPPVQRQTRRGRLSTDHPGVNLHLELTRPRRAKIVWTWASDVSSHLYRRFLLDVAPLAPLADGRYQDLATDEVLTLSEAAQRYVHLLPPDLGPPGEEQPKELTDFLSDTKVYLIETQRLLNLPKVVTNTRSARQPPGSELPKSRVSLYSDDLTKRFREALAQNSRRSQDLDRTFPGRLLEDDPSLQVTDEEIRQKYRKQTEFRSRLAEIDVLGTPTDYIPLPERDLAAWERRVLWTYLQDAERKLETFEDLLSRVRLLQEIVNSRFKYKTIHISRDRGFVIVTDDQQQEIAPDRLSSGEQHELVLVYDLLFQVQEDTVVLIDEPEISLHVGWQRQFLYDLFEISKLTSLRFIIATHSPQIIHKWRDRTVSLVPQSEMDDE
ncbi:AAA family ATPase [Phytohabitans suffuscus]|uniref:ATPase AAA-type core domain-containing protein n=1 Tax=Phytohabitans suffuscus TaxID=624315 RepID=A0A6F8YMR5_9ACTN|nr:AAA family ATPase [Phytohabitans suffuscus]BCB87435.1 hypothetical protein Psuf_047480 [Phytohabitans suffuscus]